MRSLLRVERLKEGGCVESESTLSELQQMLIGFSSLSPSNKPLSLSLAGELQRAYGGRALIFHTFSPAFVSDYHSERSRELKMERLQDGEEII